MKRSIIILVALIVLCAMPVLASTPEQEDTPLASEDELFLGEMSQLSEEELINIIGNMHPDMDGNCPGMEDLVCGLPKLDYETLVKIATQAKLSKVWRFGIGAFVISAELNSDGTVTISISIGGWEGSITLDVDIILKPTH